jgi:tryptophanyl-tRNA synthetase
MSKKRILAGMRPSGKLHIGHYHGALTSWLRLQEEHDCFFFSADWHALTTEFADPSRVNDDTIEMALDWLAAGLDPAKSTIFVQSLIPEHAELFLVFGMITPVPWLERNPTYKEQREQIQDKDLGNFGFLGYPCLQAADILIYKAQGVPVGIDQAPHVELTREIARRFNHLYGPLFPEPDVVLSESPKVPGTDGRKMSKSYGNAVLLADPPEVVTKKIQTMMTDPARKRRTDPGDPDLCPVYDLHRIYSSPETLAWSAAGCRSAGIGCLECKKPLIEKVIAHLLPIQARRAELARDPETVRTVLREGSARAREVARATWDEARRAIGMARI